MYPVVSVVSELHRAIKKGVFLSSVPQGAIPAAVLFDMDGTLVDSEHLWLAAELEVMSDLGATWTSADQEHCLGGPLERVADYMIERSGTSVSSHEVGQRLLGAIERRLRSEPVSWRPGALELLRECRSIGVPTALVTASWAVLVQALADRMHDEVGQPPFDVVVAGDDITNSKPHPEPYETAARLLHVSPAQALAIEDSPTGVRSAVAAGCVVVAVPHIATIGAAIGAHVVTNTLRDRSLSDLWNLAHTGGSLDL